jgi:hypothetical protein
MTVPACYTKPGIAYASQPSSGSLSQGPALGAVRYAAKAHLPCSG